MSEILIIDYGQGNIRSIAKRLEEIGASYKVGASVQDIENAGKIILPGVGHFGQAMQSLDNLGIIPALNHKVLVEKTPVMGICLGMQIMCKFSEEGNVAGLGWIDADVKRFQPYNTAIYKVPHVGWNKVNITDSHFKLDSIADFYFVHSFYVTCADANDNCGITDYEQPFTSMFRKDNIIGCQFHPEKSHDAGAALIEKFVQL